MGLQHRVTAGWGGEGGVWEPVCRRRAGETVAALMYTSEICIKCSEQLLLSAAAPCTRDAAADGAEGLP